MPSNSSAKLKAVDNTVTDPETGKEVIVIDPKYGYIPEVNPSYVPWGHFNHIVQIIRSKKFYPIWITGLAGNGKTQMIEQACAVSQLPKEYFNETDSELQYLMMVKERFGYMDDEYFRDETSDERRAEMEAEMIAKGLPVGKQIGSSFIRVNFTMETDENDLIGGFRLVNGDTVFWEGPVVTALKTGATLLLDEIDVGHTNKIMCLQSVLEGKGVLIKATGEWIKPAPGFNIFATSNTKGKGSDDGKFIGTNMMNGAFMDRFAGMIHQEYPPFEVESEILKRYFCSYHWDGLPDDELDDEALDSSAQFCENLCKWAIELRDNYHDGRSEDLITTRSLINIIQGYAIFGEPRLAIQLSCERFNDATKITFMEFFNKMFGAPAGDEKPPEYTTHTKK